MSLIDFLPPIGTGGGGGDVSLSGNNAFTGNNTHAGSEAFNAQFLLAKQSFSATGTIVDGSGSVVLFTGTTASQTLSLPASPSTNRIVLVRNESTQTVTLSGNGINVDGAASVTVPVNGAGLIWYDGTAWWSIAPSAWLAITWQAAATFAANATFSSAATVSGAANINGRLQVAPQTAGTASYTVTNTSTSASAVLSTYSSTGAQTITLPSSPQTDEVHWIVDGGLAAATNNVTISGNGKTIDGASSITLTKNGAAVQLLYTGTVWVIVGAYNYP